MNRYDFIQELKHRLRKLPYDEIKEAVEYYEQYFDDAGEENERGAIAELGSPAEAASQIIAEFAIKGTGGSKTSAKSGLSTVMIVILAIFASPVALPVAIAAIAVAFAVVISIIAVLFSIGVSGLAFILSGIVCAVTGFAVIAQDFATTMLCGGVGMVCFGLGIILTKATAALSQKCFGWLAQLIGKFILRKGARKAQGPNFGEIDKQRGRREK